MLVHSFTVSAWPKPVTLLSFEQQKQLSKLSLLPWHPINHQNVVIFQNDQQLDCALDLMRRLPPQQIEKNLSDLIDLVSKIRNQTKRKCHGIDSIHLAKEWS